MLAEATLSARDSVTLRNYELDDLDGESFAQYRNLFRSTRPQHPFLEGDDRELLRSLGGMKLNRETGEYELTLAGLLMFGSSVSISEELPHFTLDYQEKRSPETHRWSDRLTTDGSWAGNLFQFFRRAFPKLVSDIKVPFQLDSQMRRVDETEVHEALREALVNCVIHADYESTTPIRVVKGDVDFEFRNPGRLRVPKEQALAGGVSDCRNPSIQKMFQMIGAGEKAGSGLPTIIRSWKDQHWRAPILDEDIVQETTTLTLSLASLLPSVAVAKLEESLGNRFKELDRNEQIVLVTNWLEEVVTHERLMQVLDIHSRDLTLMLEKLVRDGLLIRQGTGRGCHYELSIGSPKQGDIWTASKAPHPEDMKSSDKVESSSYSGENSSPKSANSSYNDENSSHSKESEQPGDEPLLDEELWAKLSKIAEPISRTKRTSDRSIMEDVILKLCEQHALNGRQLAALLGRNSTSIRNNYLSPLVKSGRLRLTHPERINHPQQAYLIADVALR